MSFKFASRLRQPKEKIITGVRAFGVMCSRTAPLMLMCIAPAFGQFTRTTGDQLRTIVDAHTDASYTFRVSDCGKLLTFSNAADIAAALPYAGPSGIGAGCRIEVRNTGNSTVFITADISTIDGSAGISLNGGEGAVLISDGVNYYGLHGQSSGGSSGGTSLTFKSDGLALGTATSVNIVSGTGVTCTPQLSSGMATLQCDADTAYLASKSALQGAGNPQICTSSSGSGSAYTASCATLLQAYAARQTLFWFADVANTSAAPTLNIDTLGARTLVRQDSGSIGTGDIKSQTLYRIWYDGTNMRVAEAGTSAGTSGLADPGANGLVKRSSNNVTTTAIAGTDYAPATTGTSLLRGNGAGGFAAASINRAIGYSFDGGGVALTPGGTKFLSIPFSCSLSAWNIAVDGGTATVKVFRKAAGLGVPSSADSISTSGIAIAAGTALHSTTLSDFTATAISANDVLGFNLFAVNSASYVNVILECVQ